MEAYIDTLCLLAHPKEDNNKFTNKKITRTARIPNNVDCMELRQPKLKKKHSSRPVGGVETGSWGGEDVWQGSGWRTGAGQVAAGGVDGPTFACR